MTDARRPRRDPDTDDGPDCRCGDVRAAHVHNRDGSDCSLCACLVYRRPLSVLRWLGMTR